MDSTFGTFISDALKLVNYRAARTGIHHRHDIQPLDPRPGDPVTVRVITPGDAAFEQVALYLTTDGSQPSGSRGVAQNGTTILFERETIEWDIPLWGYVIHWKAIIPGQPDGTLVQYVISAWADGSDEVYADTPNIDDIVQHATMVHFKNIPASTEPIHTGQFPGENVFNYHVDTHQPPAWAHDAIIYHIFVDRFYPGDGQAWQPSDKAGRLGGTLWGVRDKLDYIADLGANCIWLSPTWASPSYHGYDVTDYSRTEPCLGGDEALRAVVEGAHQRGIRVLLDMACNHLSNEHPFFQDALKNKNSPYRDWFFFHDGVMHRYKTFFGVGTMPRVNLDFPAAREWMIANAVRWLRDFDVDGYRLDVADGPGPNFWSHFREACRAAKPDCLIYGEIIDTPQRLRIYAGRLDGVLDFPLADAIRRTYAFETLTESQLQTFIRNNTDYYPDNFVRPIFLDNHDMNRFSYIAGNDADKLKRAAAFQMTLPGPVIIYYGTEVGLRQPISDQETDHEQIRAPMIWDDRQDRDLLTFYKQQIQARKQRKGR